MLGFFVHLCTKKIISNIELGEDMNKFLQLVCILLITSFSAKAQTGEIQGRVLDDKGEPVPFAIVIVITDQAGKQRTSKGTKADANGRYTLKGLNPGTYNLMATSVGKPNTIELGIQVFAGRPTEQNFVMELRSNTKKEVIIKAVAPVKPPKLIDVYKPKENVIGEQEVKDASMRDVGSIAASTGGIVQSDVGGGLNAGGGREGGLVYFVDGVKMTGSPGVPATEIAQMEVFTSGIPAKYGDADAAVITIITKGPSAKLMGKVEGLTSKFLDPFGYNLGGFSLRGPIIRGKAKIDTMAPGVYEKIKGESILGFSINGEYEYKGDNNPTINGNWKVKDDVLKNILDNPYRLSADGSQLLLSQSFLTINDLERTNSHQNTSAGTFRINGKLDWKVIKNSTNITLGFRGENNEFNNYIQRYSLLNYQNNPIYRNKSFNAYLRLYQPLFNSDKQVNKAIRNTTMTLQADVTLSGQDFKSPIGGDNPWHYGYIGKFEEERAWNWERKTGGDGEKVFYNPNQYLTFTDFVSANASTSNAVKFTPGTINAPAAAQTAYFLNMYNNTVGKTDQGPLRSITAIENAGGVINGLRANITVHDLFFPATRVFNGIQKQENAQLRVTGAFNFDIEPVKNKSAFINKHTIELGFELEQRINRSYNINPLTLWTLAQSSYLNSHLAPDNNRNFNPLMIMRGGTVRMRLQDYRKQDTITFAAFDTLLYDKEVSNGAQANFSRNLRNELFEGDSISRINIHELDPNKMKLHWFSADELLNNRLVSGNGYDVYGNYLPASTTFNEFFTAKDDKGNFLRHVAAFMPRYGAAYIQDRFQLKSLALNIGLRVDYFDPNTNTLRDPYVPQGGRTISMVDSIGGAKALHPKNLPSDAVVYVDKTTGPGRITGYRAGDQWYSKDGAEIAGAGPIEIESGGNIQPYLIGNTEEERDKRTMGSTTFDPELMFRKVTPRFALSPRVNFSFNIDTFALLFAHYDIMTQRPEIGAPTALDYYNLLQRRNISFINNPDLDFSSTTDLEVGFKQRLNARSTLTVNFQYREYSNQISVTRIQGAYPAAYNTFSNSDFSTVKSIGLAFEQRRMKNLKLKANYTMSFAEGTSSSRTAQLNLINSGLGNIRVIYPLNWDTRHNLNFIANYKFDSRDPYNKGIPKFLRDITINFDLNLRSGTPFTQQTAPTPEAYMNSTARAVNLGDINSGSLPWRFMTNFKLDKDLTFKFGKSDSSKNKGLDNRREFGLNIYLQITNLFNSMNVLDVYRYTGSPTTDGYLNGPDGNLDYISKEAIAKGYGQAFRDLYNVALEIPDGRNSMFIRPRVIQLGAVLSF